MVVEPKYSNVTLNGITVINQGNTHPYWVSFSANSRSNGAPLLYTSHSIVCKDLMSLIYMQVIKRKYFHEGITDSRIMVQMSNSRASQLGSLKNSVSISRAINHHYDREHNQEETCIYDLHTMQEIIKRGIFISIASLFPPRLFYRHYSIWQQLYDYPWKVSLYYIVLDNSWRQWIHLFNLVVPVYLHHFMLLLLTCCTNVMMIW